MTSAAHLGDGNGAQSRGPKNRRKTKESNLQAHKHGQSIAISRQRTAPRFQPSAAQNTRSQIVFKKDLHLQLAEEALWATKKR